MRSGASIFFSEPWNPVVMISVQNQFRFLFDFLLNAISNWKKQMQTFPNGCRVKCIYFTSRAFYWRILWHRGKYKHFILWRTTQFSLGQIVKLENFNETKKMEPNPKSEMRKWNCRALMENKMKNCLRNHQDNIVHIVCICIVIGHRHMLRTQSPTM